MTMTEGLPAPKFVRSCDGTLVSSYTTLFERATAAEAKLEDIAAVIKGWNYADPDRSGVYGMLADVEAILNRKETDASHRPE